MMDKRPFRLGRSVLFGVILCRTGATAEATATLKGCSMGKKR
jgi:hypothetical protein